jgi:hypothetical protein
LESSPFKNESNPEAAFYHDNKFTLFWIYFNQSLLSLLNIISLWKKLSLKSIKAFFQSFYQFCSITHKFQTNTYPILIYFDYAVSELLSITQSSV